MSVTDILNTIEDEYSPTLADKSQIPYDNKILGIMSSINEVEAPGEGQRKAEYYHLLALAGRVIAKVSTENGPIKVGDPITSSSMPRVGMKATEAGRVVGIALQDFGSIPNSETTEPVATEPGTILVFINLHWIGNDLSVQEVDGTIAISETPQAKFLATLGLSVNEYGALEIQKLKTEQIEITNPYGITIYDVATGEPRCIISKNGQIQSLAGKCEDLVPSESIEPLPVEESPVEEQAPEEPTFDTIAPAITIIGSTTIDLIVGDTYIDEGATAQDDTDGDITANIVVSNTVDTSVTGIYSVIYTVSDSSGNTAIPVERTVNVVDIASKPPPEESVVDATSPVIILIGEAAIDLIVEDTYIDEGATAQDDTDGDITANIVVSNTVDTSVEGAYIVAYNVADAAGNAADEVSRTVTVTAPADIVPSVITLIGSATVELVVGDTYVDEGVTAIDDVDGDIVSSIITDNPVDTSVSGTYTITYNVSDLAGNAATPVERTVNVIDSTEESLVE